MSHTGRRNRNRRPARGRRPPRRHRHHARSARSGCSGTRWLWPSGCLRPKGAASNKSRRRASPRLGSRCAKSGQVGVAQWHGAGAFLGRGWVVGPRGEGGGLAAVQRRARACARLARARASETIEGLGLCVDPGRARKPCKTRAAWAGRPGQAPSGTLDGSAVRTGRSALGWRPGWLVVDVHHAGRVLIAATPSCRVAWMCWVMRPMACSCTPAAVSASRAHWADCPSLSRPGISCDRVMEPQGHLHLSGMCHRWGPFLASRRHSAKCCRV